MKLSDFGDDALDEAAIDRISERIAADGPRVVKRAQRIHTATRAGGVVVAVSTAFFGAWWWSGRTEVAPTLQPSLQPELAAARRCEAWPAELGDRARVMPDEGAVVHTEVLEACRIVLRLESGRVVVHAKDLGGGELSVVTPSGVVRVHGTIFAVSQRVDVFSVDVAEGVVEVRSQMIRAGERIEGSKVEKLSEDERAALEREARGEVRRPSAVVAKRRPRAAKVSPPVETAEELAMRALKLRQSGDLAGARDLYRRAGAEIEAAWIALARLELGAGDLGAALSALDDRDRRFPGGDLEQEARGLRLTALERSGDRVGARKTAEEIRKRWPGSGQAKAADRWLREHP